MKQEILIRQLKINDLDEFFKLRLESLQLAPTSFLSSYEDEKNNGPSFYENILKNKSNENVIFGAFVEDHLVGIIGIYQSHFKRLKHKATLWGIYVKPEQRKKEIAKKLMEVVINHARKKMKCLFINLCVGTDNKAAQSLYKSFGFIKWGTEPGSISIDGKLFDEDHMILSFK